MLTYRYTLIQCDTPIFLILFSANFSAAAFQQRDFQSILLRVIILSWNVRAWLSVNSDFPFGFLFFLSRSVDVMLSELHMIQLYREAQPAHTALFRLAIEIRWPRFSCWMCIHLTISLAPTSEQMRSKAALLRTWFSCRILNSDNQQEFMSWMKNIEKKNDERISFWRLKSNSESSIRKTVGSIFWCKSFD